MSWLLRRAAPSLLPSLGDKVQASCSFTPPWAGIRTFDRDSHPAAMRARVVVRQSYTALRSYLYIFAPSPARSNSVSSPNYSLNSDPITGCWSRLRQYYACITILVPRPGFAHFKPHRLFWELSELLPSSPPPSSSSSTTPPTRFLLRRFRTRPYSTPPNNNSQTDSNITKLQLQPWSLLGRRSPS